MARFEELLLELGDALDTTLHSDERRVCRIEVNQLIEVQLEMSSDDRDLIIGCEIIEVPPGKFRERALIDFLRANDFLNMQVGCLSYLPERNLLFIHHRTAIESLQLEDLIEILTQFTNQAYQWKEALQAGRSSPEGALIDPNPESTNSTIQMGLKP